MFENQFLEPEENFIIPLLLGFLVFTVIMYIFTAYATMKVAEKCGYEYAWLAWIPIVNQFVLYILVKDHVHPPIRNNFMIIAIVVYIISLLISPLAILTAILYFYAFYIVSTWFSDKPVAHTVIAVLTLGFSIAISLFMFRKRTPNKISLQ